MKWFMKTIGWTALFFLTAILLALITQRFLTLKKSVSLLAACSRPDGKRAEYLYAF